MQLRRYTGGLHAAQGRQNEHEKQNLPQLWQDVPDIRKDGVMITDTCKCGAAVTIKANHASWERVAHKTWLDAHAECRWPAGAFTAEIDTSGMLGAPVDLRG